MAGDLCVRYEDDDLIVADKPAGMHTAPLARGDTGTLLELILQAFPEIGALPGIKTVEPGLVHRLDRGTSGLVVVARTPAAFEALRLAFASGAARKDYLAACPARGEGGEPGVQLRMESRFAPYGPGRRMVRAVLPGERSEKLLAAASPALYTTEARVIERRGPACLVRAWILRGFRHQVRVHLAFLGFPILGDPLYGVAAPEAAAARMYLHAGRIELPHPASGRRLVVESPVPAEFLGLLEPSKGAFT